MKRSIDGSDLLVRSLLTVCCVAALISGLACSQDDPAAPPDTHHAGAYVDEGSAAAPLDITGSLPYAGQVSPDGWSYYRISGVAPAAIFTIMLIRTDGLPYPVVPHESQGGGLACGWNDTTRGDTIECPMRATSGGLLDFAVEGDADVGGAGSLDFSPGGVIDEGGPHDPVIVNSFPFSGGCFSQSYYVLTGLTHGGAYAISFEEADGPVAFIVFPDSTYQSQRSVCALSNDAKGTCNVVADASGQIYLLTHVLEGLRSTMYRISVTAIEVANGGA